MVGIEISVCKAGQPIFGGRSKGMSGKESLARALLAACQHGGFDAIGGPSAANSHGTSHVQVSELLAAGADPQARDARGVSALSFAAQQREDQSGRANEDVIALIEAGADVNSSSLLNEGALHFAARAGSVGAAAALLGVNNIRIDRASTLMGHEWTPLLEAAASGHADRSIEIARMLVDRGANPYQKDSLGRGALELAQSEAMRELFREEGCLPSNTLIQSTVDDNQSTSTGKKVGEGEPQASELPGPVNVEIQLSSEVLRRRIDERATSRLLKLAGRTDAELSEAEDLLDAGASVEARDAQGRSALSLASESNAQQILSLLLERGADVNSIDIHGQTALHYAARCGNETVLRLLLASPDVKVDVVSSQLGKELTPFLEAAGGQHGQHSLAVAKLLLGRGANIAQRDSLGRNALALARSDAMRSLLRDEGLPES